MNNINKIIEIFDKTIDEYSNPRALVYQCIFKKCLNAILNNYYAGSVAQVIDSNESMDHIYAVADASESCVNMLPLPTKDPNV